MTNTLYYGAAALGVLGLFIGLPNLDTFLIDFTQFGVTAITMMRLGLLLLMFHFLSRASGGES